MKVKTVFLWLAKDIPVARATIEVPGLGDAEIEHALSQRLCEEICTEAIAALRIKLGQVLVTREVSPDE